MILSSKDSVTNTDNETKTTEDQLLEMNQLQLQPHALYSENRV